MVEDVAAVADLQAAAGVLFDDDHGYAGFVDLAHADEGFVLEHWGQACGGLVEQEDGWFHHEGSGHGHHLTFAAGKLAGELVLALAEFGEDGAHVVEAFVEQFRCLERAHVQVFRDGQAGEDVFGLRHEADATGDEFVGAQVGDVLAFQQQLAGVDVHQAEQ